MKEDKLFVQEALGYLDPELLEESEKTMGKKRRPAPVRALMAAACICALLIIGSVAVELLEFDFVHIFGEQEEKKTVYMRIEGDEEAKEMGLVYEVNGSGAVKNIPLSDLSPALQELQEQYKEEDWYTQDLAFGSWEEAEEYIGHEISDNAVLDQAEYVPSTYGIVEHSREVEGNCIVFAAVKHGELNSVDVHAQYRLSIPGAKDEDTESIHVSVEAHLFTGDELPMYPVFMLIDNGHLTAAGQESYLTANGLEAVIIDVKDVQDGEIQSNGSYHAFFFLRGVRFKLEVGYWGDRAEPVLTTLKQVLDAYQ